MDQEIIKQIKNELEKLSNEELQKVLEFICAANAKSEYNPITSFVLPQTPDQRTA